MNLIKQSVDTVATGLQGGLERGDIIKNLQRIGIPQQFLEDTYMTIESGLKNGVNAAVTNGLSAQGYTPGKSQLYDAAFTAGYKAFKWEVRKVWIRRIAIVLAIIASICFAFSMLKKP